MRYTKLIPGLAVLGLIFIGLAGATATCPTLSSVTVFLNDKNVGSEGTFAVNVGDYVGIQVCCQNKMDCRAILSVTWIDGRDYTRKIKAKKSNQCERFNFEIGSELTKEECVGPIQIISNCQDCGQSYAGDICFIAKKPDCSQLLADVYRLIDDWKADKIELQTVIDAINRWANCGSDQGESAANIEQQKAQLMAMLQPNEILDPVSQCDPGYHLENGQCVQDIMQCDPGYHLENGQCVQDIMQCDPGYHLENGQCVQDIPQCDPGYHLENGQCVQDIPQCDPGYHLENGQCVQDIPQCNPGYHLENGQCVQDIPQCDPGYHIQNGDCFPDQVPSDPTCGLAYVMDLINKWQANEASLSEVINAINHWASSECTASSGLAPSAVEQQKAQLMAMLQNPSNQVLQEEQQEWPSNDQDPYGLGQYSSNPYEENPYGQEFPF